MSKKDKTSEIIEVESSKPARKWNVGSVFWGLLLVLVGVLLLLDNFNVLSVNFTNIWQLWPVLIIGTGLSMLSLRGWIGGIVSFATAALLLCLVAFVVVDNPLYTHTRGSQAQVASQEDAANGAKKLDVTVDVGAANIEFSSSREQLGVKAVQESNRAHLVKSAETKGDVRHVLLSTESSRVFWLGGMTNSLKVDLTRSLPVALTVDTGAASVTGDLSQVRLASLVVDTGASSIDVRLGAIEKRQEVAIDAGASSVTLHIPKAVGVRVELSGGLKSTHFEAIDKKSDSLYETADFDLAEKHIIVRADMGASRFEIRRY